MNKAVLLLVFCIFQKTLFAQHKTPTTQQTSPIHVPMSPSNWSFAPGACEFGDHGSVSYIHLLHSKDTANLKDLHFTNGTIEFDLEPQDSGFAAFYFRRQSVKESECFYLRCFAGGIPNIMTAVQYTPVMDGVSLWNLLPYCQGTAKFAVKQRNHIKLVVSGSQMLVYVNEDNRPTLEIPQLEGNTTAGGLGFEGKVVVSSLTVTPDATQGLSAVAGFDPMYNDPRYLRQWSVSQPIPFPVGRDLTTADLPKEATNWKTITAERRGLINLTRLYGNSEHRRLVWLKCRLKSPTAREHKIDFGFTNEVWIFLNGKLLMVDKNLFDELLRKQPRGRVSLENTSFTLPLQEGDNEIMIGLANDFYGWGIIARFDVLEGIEIL